MLVGSREIVIPVVNGENRVIPPRVIHFDNDKAVSVTKPRIPIPEFSHFKAQHDKPEPAGAANARGLWWPAFWD